MTPIFDQLRDLVEKKSNTLLDDFDTQQDFSPYLVNRWLSMMSKEHCQLVNETTNKCYRGVEDKSQWYKLFQVILPKQRFRYINYIKKNKEKTKQKYTEEIKLLSSYYQTSVKEIEDLIERGLITEQQLKEINKK